MSCEETWFIHVFREANFTANVVADLGHGLSTSCVWENGLPLNCSFPFYFDLFEPACPQFSLVIVLISPLKKINLQDQIPTVQASLSLFIFHFSFSFFVLGPIQQMLIDVDPMETLRLEQLESMVKISLFWLHHNFFTMANLRAINDILVQTNISKLISI